MAIILITGGSGLIGTALTEHLISLGHSVRHLSRAKTCSGRIPVFHWNIPRKELEEQALHSVDHIIHLAGAGIADKRWTKSRIDELIRSRVASADLLLDRIISAGIKPRSFISAAGINYYGAVTSDRIFQETDPPGKDVISRISSEWEDAVDRWKPVCRVVKLRTPVVLAREGGALQKLAVPVRFGLGAALGRGDQWLPWVHLQDLVQIYQQAMEDLRMEGAYNAGPSTNTTNMMMMRTIAKVLGKPFLLPPIPPFVLKIALGEMSSILLEGSRADDKKVTDTGFQFRWNHLETALSDLLIGTKHHQ